MKTKRQNINTTLKNGIMLLEHLAKDAKEWSVKDLAEYFELPNSHICRLLKTLVDTGYIEQSSKTRKYSISLKVLCLSNARLRKLEIRNVARQYMQQLVKNLNCPVILSAVEDGIAIMIDTEYPPTYYNDAGLAIGERLIMNRSASGKVCAAYDINDDNIERFLDKADWIHRTEKSIVDREKFKEVLRETRERGYAITHSEQDLGVGAIAAPIFDAAKNFVGTLGTMLPYGEENWTPDLWNKYISATRKCADTISYALGYPLSQ